MRAFESPGLWWLPDNPKGAVGGILKYSEPEGLRLSLLGTLGEQRAFGRSKELPTIHGVLEQHPFDRVITLRNCLQTALSMSSPGYSSEEFYARVGFVGAHLTTDNDFGFEAIEVELSDLGEWVQTSGFSLSLRENSLRGIEGFDLSYRYPDPISGSCDGLTVAVKLRAKIPLAPQREMHLREAVSLNIAALRPRTFEEWNRDVTFPLQNFMTLASGRANAIVDLRATKLGSDNDDFRKPIQVVFQPIYRSDKERRRPIAQEMLFTSADVPDRIVPIVCEWLALSKRQQTACSVFFGGAYKQDEYLDTEFLSVCQAIEAYESQLASADGGEPEAFSNYFLRFISRVDPVVEHLEPRGQRILLEETVATRNYVVHRAPAMARSAVKGLQLYWLGEKLRILFVANLLVDLGFDLDHTMKFLGRSAKYAQLPALARVATSVVE